MAIISVANDVQLERVAAVTETTPGGGGIPTFLLPGTFSLVESRPLADIDNYNGTYMQDDQVVFGPTDISGSYGQNLSFEKLALLPRYSMCQAPTPVSDGNPTPGFTYTYNHDTNRATRQSFAAQYGFEEIPFFSTGIRIPQLSISCDTDDAQASWKVNSPTLFATSKDLLGKFRGTATGATATTLTMTGAGWTLNQFQGGWIHITKGTGRDQAFEIASNTGTGPPANTITIVGTFSPVPDTTSQFTLVTAMASPSASSDESINAEGTKTFIDDYGSPIGTTDDSFRVISWNADWDWPVSPKRFQGNVGGYDAKTGNGPMRMTGSLRMEFDSPKEYNRFKDRGAVSIRHRQTGTVISASPLTNKLAQIDIFKAVLEGPTMDARNFNRTITIPWRAYRDATENHLARLIAKTAQASLP